MFKILGLSRSTYYDRINRKLSKRSLENKKFKDLILNIYLKSKKQYGAPQIKIKLNILGYNISFKIMRELNIRSIVKKNINITAVRNLTLKEVKIS